MGGLIGIIIWMVILYP